MKIKLLVLFFLLLNIANGLSQTKQMSTDVGVSAQTNAIRTDLISPSPTAASLFRAGEVPINLSSGTLNYSIPIFNASGHELSVPISLNYSYGGFIPTQASSWVGTGWNLQAGGVITRVINDKLDNTMSANRNFQDVAIKNKIEASLSNIDHEFLDNVSTGLMDSEPDIFNFNFNGYSGKFIIYNGVFYCLPYEKFKITGGDSGFTIVTTDGISYRFDAIEQTRPKGTSGASYNIPNHNSSWYLTKITNASENEIIKLMYTSDGTLTQAGARTQTYKKASIPAYNGETSSLSTISASFPTFVDALRLTSIITEKYTVTFFADSARGDINGTLRRLGRINVVDNAFGTVKNFKLGYGFFGSGLYYNTKYLKLKFLDEVASSSGDEPIENLETHRHLFEYEDENSIYPDKLIPGVDHYGYYNGGNFNGTILPNKYYPGGPNREPVFSYAKYGALKRIQFPTKGSVLFEYEPNLANTGTQYQLTPSQKSILIARSGSGQQCKGLDNSTLVTFNMAQTVNVYLTRTAPSPFADNFTRNLYKDLRIFSLHDEDAITLIHEVETAFESDNGGKIYSFNLPAGSYYFQVCIDSRETKMSAVVSYGQNSGIPIEGEITGGIRIKKVTQISETGLPIVKKYRYTNASGFSSGYHKPDTYNNSQFQETTYGSGCVPFEHTYNVYTTFLSEGVTLGPPHYYSSVYEDLESATNNLTTRHEFINNSYYYMGLDPSVVTYYKKIDSILVPIRKTEYQYDFRATAPGLISLKPRKVMERFGGSGCFMSPPYFLYSQQEKTYYSAFKAIVKIKETDYSGSVPIIKVTDNYYDYDQSWNLTSSRVNDSGGGILINKLKYPDNYSPSLSSAFTSRNIISQPWEQQTWKKNGTDSILISANFTQYSNTMFKPIKQYVIGTLGMSAMNNETISGKLYTSLLSDSRYQERINYNYDAAGRLIGQQMVGGSPISYKWGYTANTDYVTNVGQKNYPICEIRNALPSEFFTENFEDQLSAQVGIGHTGLRYFAGDYAVSWEIPNSRSYILSYWYQEGATWKYAEQPYLGSTTLNLGSGIDDVCIYPKDAQISLFTMTKGGQRASQTDTKGLSINFEYDDFLRFKSSKDQNGNIISTHDYYYKP